MLSTDSPDKSPSPPLPDIRESQGLEGQQGQIEWERCHESLIKWSSLKFTSYHPSPLLTRWRVPHVNFPTKHTACVSNLLDHSKQELMKGGIMQKEREREREREEPAPGNQIGAPGGL
jgi:hypothetical protein